MSVETRVNYTNYPFVLWGNPAIKEAETFEQDAGRSGALAKYTLLAYDSANAKWQVFKDETATDGTQFPKGICMADLTEAEIKAGDVANVPVLVANAHFDKNQLVIEASKTLATVINVPAGTNTTVEDELIKIGLIPEDTLDIDAFA